MDNPAIGTRSKYVGREGTPSFCGASEFERARFTWIVSHEERRVMDEQERHYLGGAPNPARGWIPVRGWQGEHEEEDRSEEVAKLLGRDVCFVDDDGYQNDITAGVVDSRNDRTAYIECRSKDLDRYRDVPLPFVRASQGQVRAQVGGRHVQPVLRMRGRFPEVDGRSDRHDLPREAPLHPGVDRSRLATTAPFNRRRMEGHQRDRGVP